MAEDSDNALLPRIGGGGIPAPVLVNPLAAQNAGIQSAQGLWGIREKQAQEAWGNILQQSTDERGNVDYPKAQLLAKQAGPVVQMGMMSALKDTAGLRGAQITQAGALHNLVGNMSASLANDPSDDNVAKIRASAVASGLPATALAEIDRIAALQPEQRRAEAYKHTVAQLDALHQLARSPYQTPVITQFGGSSAPVTIQPGTPYNPPGMAVGGGIPHTQSQEDLNKIVKIGTNPDGTDRMGTQRQAQNLAAGRAADDDGPAPSSPLGTGRLPPALQNPNKPTAPGQTSPAPPAPVQPGFNVGQPPATKAAQEATGTASVGKFQAIVDQGVKARSQDALLATMLSEAQGFRPGPGADLAATVKRTILGAGAQFGTTFGIDQDKLAKQESVVKIGNQLADAQGAGSDARMHVSEGANPSVHNTPAGLDLIIRQLRGNADYLRVRQQLAAAYPDKANIEDFEAKIGANLDPRVFQYERLQPQQRADYYNGLTDKAAFRKAHDWASGQKLLGGGG